MCRTFKHPNGYTNVSICNCKYGGESHGTNSSKDTIRN